MANNAVVKDASVNPPTLYFPREQTITGTLTFSGATTTLSVNYKASKIGRMVIIDLDGGSFVKDGTAGTLTASSAIPAEFQPSGSAVYTMINGNISGVLSNIGLVIQPSGIPQAGIIQIYNASSLAGTFASGANPVIFNSMELIFVQ